MYVHDYYFIKNHLHVYLCFLGTSCYDRSTFCSVYQNSREYCDRRYTLNIDKALLPVPEACQLSCSQCAPVQNLNNILTFVIADDDNKPKLVESMDYPHKPTSSSTVTMLQPNEILPRKEKCFDRRDDCLRQKALGFCEMFNEKYPYDCTKTCHRDCTLHS